MQKKEKVEKCPEHCHCTKCFKEQFEEEKKMGMHDWGYCWKHRREYYLVCPYCLMR